jgi:hypothetical protein
MSPIPEPPAAAERILAAAREKALLLRLMGGVAVYLRCPSIRGAGRAYRDLDFVAASGLGRRIEALFSSLGYLADKTFNKLNGADRLMFWDDASGQRVDVLIDRLTMSHEIDLRRRLECDERTLSLADLLLSKLQIHQISDRDLLDIAALLADHSLAEDDAGGINVLYLTTLCADDWGLFRTCQINLERLCQFDASALSRAPHDPCQQSTELLRRLEGAPKSLKWKARAAIGERVQWYKVPEEVGR